MRFIAYERNARRGLAVADPAGRYRGLDDGAAHGRLERAVASGHDGLKDLAAALLTGEPLDPEAVIFLPPLSSPGKIICVGLAFVTDFDCWHETAEPVSVEMVVANLMQNAETAKHILKTAIATATEERPVAGAAPP